jgi:mono/diheme cytochrome c family protein
MSPAFLKKTGLVALALAALSASACRGEVSQEPPVAILRNMYFQPKYSNQAKSEFFQDKRQLRQPAPGTIAREMETSPLLAEGRTSDGAGFVDSIPIAIVQRVGDMEKLVTRGAGRYGIYCVPCHDGVGTGKGLVIQRAQNQAFQPPSFHDDRLRKMTDGQLFQTITYGANNMPPYGPQLPVDDRWAIVAYVRALQVSQGNSRGVTQ